MDLEAPGTSFNPWGRVSGPTLPPMNVVWKFRKIGQAKNHVENYNFGSCLGGARASSKLVAPKSLLS
jgi:hypothetical protein